MATASGTSTDKPGPKPTDASIEDQVGQLRADLSKLVDAIGDRATGEFNRYQARAEERVGELEEQVRRNPLTTIAIALGLGFLFGAILRR